jgi:hypothetical protein
MRLERIRTHGFPCQTDFEYRVVCETEARHIILGDSTFPRVLARCVEHALVHVLERRVIVPGRQA